jgi:hypothetical protein
MFYILNNNIYYIKTFKNDFIKTRVVILRGLATIDGSWRGPPCITVTEEVQLAPSP